MDRSLAFDIHVATSVREKRKEMKEMQSGLSAFKWIRFSNHFLTSTIGPVTVSVCWLPCAYELKIQVISGVGVNSPVKCHVLNSPR